MKQSRRKENISTQRSSFHHHTAAETGRLGLSLDLLVSMRLCTATKHRESWERYNWQIRALMKQLGEKGGELKEEKPIQLKEWHISIATENLENTKL